MKKNLFWVLMVSVFLLYPDVAFCQFDETEMALFEEIPIVVTSASGRAQKMKEVSNAMYVITREDIERSGVQDIADLFYKVPGMQVRRIDRHRFFVGVRGEAQIATANLLVLIDGVVVFNPAFTGTFWEALPITIDEVERIEIIRGPGGVLYSSNAVNGVINIMTRKATDEENYVTLLAGTMDYKASSLGLSYKKDKLSLRGYGDFSFDHGYNRKHTVNGSSASVPDRTKRNNTGIKAQYDFSKEMRLLADVKYQQYNTTNDASTGYLRKKLPGSLATLFTKFEHEVSESYDYNIHLDCANHMYSYATTSDSDVIGWSASTQHNWAYDLLGSHILSAGAELRFNHINITSANYLEPFADPEQTQRVLSYFMQNEYRPTEKWILTSGVRVSSNQMLPDQVDKYMIEPKAAVMYRPNKNHTIRAVATKSFRTPSISDHQAYAYVANVGGLNLYVRGDNAIEPEVAWTYEFGWRGLLLDKKLSMNADFFVVNLVDPITFVNSVAPPNIFSTLGNNGNMRTVGFELDGKYNITNNLSMNFDYTYTEPNLDTDHDHSGLNTNGVEYHVTKHQAGGGLRYTKDKFDFDFYGKWISEYYNPTTAPLYDKYPSYIKVMVRVARDVNLPWLEEDDYEAEIELVATDFVGARVTESTYNYFREPNVYAGLKVKF